MLLYYCTYTLAKLLPRGEKMTEKNNRLILGLIILMMILSLYQTNRITSLNDELKTLNLQLMNLKDSQGQEYQILRSEIMEELRKANSFVSDFRYNFKDASNGNIAVEFQLIPNEIRDGELFRVELWGENDQYPIMVILEKVGDIRYIGSISIPISKDYKVHIVSSYNNAINIHKVSETLSPSDRFGYSFHGFSQGSVTWRQGKVTTNRQYTINYMPDTTNGIQSSISDVKLNIKVNGNLKDSYYMERIGSSIDDTYTFIFHDHPLEFSNGDEIIIYSTAKDSRGFNFKWTFEHFRFNSDGHMESIESNANYTTIIY